VWTVADFHRVRESGVWDGRRAILLNGTVWELGPMNPPHAVLVGLAHDAVRAAFGPGFTVRSQLPLVLGLWTDPFPDIAVVPGGPRDYLAAHPTTARLVVEVADSTLSLDLTEKAELYATANIGDYWVVDVENRRLIVLRDPAPVAAGGAAYRTQLALGPGDTVSPLAAPGATVRVADLLP
jgi:hypothetical protein